MERGDQRPWQRSLQGSRKVVGPSVSLSGEGSLTLGWRGAVKGGWRDGAASHSTTSITRTAVRVEQRGAGRGGVCS